MEAGAVARDALALDPDTPTVQLDKAAADRQPQPRAIALARQRAIELAKLFKDPVVIGWGDADPSVGHGDAHLRSIYSDVHADAPPIREAARVVEEVEQYLPHPCPVHVDRRQVGWDLACQLDLLAAYQGAHDVYGLGDHLLQIGGFAAEAQTVRLDL
jgi:hypothetical protein